MKRLLSLLLTTILVCGLVACGEKKSASDNNATSEKADFYKGYVTSQSRFLEKTSYGNYAGYVNLAYEEVNMSDTSDRKKVLLDEDGDQARLIAMAQDGDDFYGWNNRDRQSDLFHVSIIDDQNVKKEVWVDRDTLVDSCVSVKHDSHLAVTLTNFIADGDSVYATLGYDAEYMVSQVPINGRIVRISKSGDTIEFVGDESVRAVELVAKDGWIYYADNGYTATDNLRYSFDNQKSGIYKIKTDGSEKSLLYGGEGKTGSHSQPFANAGDLALYQDYLYFLDLNNDSRLCRIKTDGSGYEQLSSDGADIYTMDTQTDTLYYQTGVYGETSQDSKQIVSLTLDTRASSVLYDMTYSIDSMICCDNYLYFYRYNSGNQTIASRIHLSTGKAQDLIWRTEGNGWERDEDGNVKRDENNKPIYTQGTITIKWYDL